MQFMHDLWLVIWVSFLLLKGTRLRESRLVVEDTMEFRES
jgi:hypothetical protein